METTFREKFVPTPIPRPAYLQLLRDDRLEMIRLRKLGYKIREVADFMATTPATVSSVIKRAKKNGEWDEVPNVTLEDLTNKFLDEPESKQVLAESRAYDEDVDKGVPLVEARKKHGFEVVTIGDGHFL